jgi:hypothetical protein
VEKYLVTKLGPLVELKAGDVRAALNTEDREKAKEVEERMAPLKAELRSYGKIQALYDGGAPPPTYLADQAVDQTDHDLEGLPAGFIPKRR